MSTSVASVTSHFPSPQNGFSTTLASTVSSGATTVPLNSVAGYTNGQIVALVVDPTGTTKQTFTGIVDTSGVQITSVVWTAGTNVAHSGGATVVDYFTATHIAMLAKGLAVSHNQDGTMITSLPLITPKVTTSLNDSSGNEVFKITATAAAVNEVTFTNAATGNSPRIAASGGDAAAHLNLRGLGLAKTVTIGAGAATIFPYDFVLSGCVWTADSVGVNLNASMTAGVVVINGNPITVALVTAKAFTLNLDTYIDVLDNGDGTGLVVYTTAATNAASPALASNSIRIGIIQAAATITATTKVNQGQEDRVFPIASSIPYAVTDSIGNLICPRDPQRRIIGYRQIVSNFSTASGSHVDVTGLNLNCIIPTGRKAEVSVYMGDMSASVANNGGTVAVIDVTAGATAAETAGVSNASSDIFGVALSLITSAGGTRNYKVQLHRGTNAATVNSGASATNPNFIMVKLV